MAVFRGGAGQTSRNQLHINRNRINSESGVANEGGGLMVRLGQPTVRQSIAATLDVLMPDGSKGPGSWLPEATMFLRRIAVGQS